MSGTFVNRRRLDNHFYQNSKFYQLFLLTPTIHICKQNSLIVRDWTIIFTKTPRSISYSFWLAHFVSVSKQTCCTVTAIQYGRHNCSAEYNLSVHSISYDATRCQEIANKAATEQNAWTVQLPNIWHLVGTDYLTYTTQVHCIHNGFRTGIGLWHSVISTHIQAPDIMIHSLT